MPELTISPAEPLTLRLEPAVRLDEDTLFEICSSNPELRIERTAMGELVIMSPAGGKTSDRNSEINMQLRSWARRDKTGRCFDSSGGFTLPNGAMRSPDGAWVELERLTAVPASEKERFLPLCPTFVIELRSPSDPLSKVEEKMEEYLANGARLGWLIDPTKQRVHVYRPNAEVEVLAKPSSVTADPELPGFELDLDEIWNPSW